MQEVTQRITTEGRPTTVLTPHSFIRTDYSDYSFLSLRTARPPRPSTSSDCREAVNRDSRGRPAAAPCVHITCRWQWSSSVSTFVRTMFLLPSFLHETFPGCHMTTALERRAEVALSPPSCLCQHNPFINGTTCSLNDFPIAAAAAVGHGKVPRLIVL